MVALVLSSIVILAVIEIFIGARQMYRVQEAKSRLQENARLAVQLISQSALNTGYRGCGSRAAIPLANSLNNATDFEWDFGIDVLGNEASDNSWLPAKPDFITTDPEDPIVFDLITFRTILEPTIPVFDQDGDAFGSGDLNVGGAGDLEVNDIVVVSDCLNAAVFEITAAGSAISHASSAAPTTTPGNAPTTTPGNATTQLGKRYENAQLNRIVTRSFFLRTPPATPRPQVPSLYMREAPSGQEAQELVEGVENMQILYGIDTNLDSMADEYRTANNVGNWENVVSLEIQLLMVSATDNLTMEPQEYTFDGNNIIANDNRIREVYSQTIALRNRLP
ncbi:Type IV fimbrial biogenesis protein PilW [Methylophaga frappieri]|uniref:Type IV fimbrial biogenesis protein PilW n=2 Tax=Methylophaga frappieri (strain ATCC BAA-2434 / DSM 25690 / JAM7) TaxID=754477 RepID=I1YKL4_METFJ|nr:Type IV fimbrial biogenesis protein PilW [Methylophaga frappieri]